MGEAKFPVLLENHWVEVNPREPSADAGWVLWASCPHQEEKAGGYSLACKASGGCSRVGKFLHPGGGQAGKSLAKSA